MTDWRKDVQRSLYGQLLLPLHEERAVEAAFSGKKVLDSMPLIGLPEGSLSSPGSIQKTEDGFLLASPLRRECWPEGMPQDGDYCNWGQADAIFKRGSAKWTGMNRLRLEARVTLPGAETVTVNAAILLEDSDAYAREGETTFNLPVGEWRSCFFEFPELDMSRAYGVRLYVLLNGQDTVMGSNIQITFRGIALEKIENPEAYQGWACQGIAVSTAGYLPQGEKNAVSLWQGEEDFTVQNESGLEYTGKPRHISNEKGDFALLDFSSIDTPGQYRLRYGEWTAVFTIREDLIQETLWKSVNFLYGERCGFPVPGRHCACHLDLLAHHGTEEISYAGGWHDAGDVSQQTLQTGEVTLALLEAAEKMKKSDPLAQRLALEAEWGLDFILRTRFGDGFRATSAGATRWTDNKIGNVDDIAVRVHDHPFENLMLSGVEAAAARILARFYPHKTAGILPTAEEDFAYGIKAYEDRGIPLPSMYEHSYHSGKSLYEAAAAWAAGQLYRATGKKAYLLPLKEHLNAMLACQETEGPLPGPFYRDENKTMLMHFNHQSREYLYMDALTQALHILPEGNEAWKNAARLYADYLKTLRRLGLPYGMLPAGLHRMDEAEDADTFRLSHLLVDYRREKKHYEAQLRAGIPLDDQYCVRMFPVWFSFRGNTAVHMSMGRAAASLGQWMKDEELKNIAREQLYWVLGKNPFSQSLQYGMGSRYCSQYAVFPGELTGEMPVGIQTRGDEDIPFWPQGVNATYKEVWTSAVGRWVGLIAAVMEEEPC